MLRKKKIKNHNLILNTGTNFLGGSTSPIYSFHRVWQPFYTNPVDSSFLLKQKCVPCRTKVPPLQATTLLWHVKFSGFAAPFSWPKKLLSKLISTLKSTEFICQAHAEFCFIWRFCVHAEKHYGILKGVPGSKIRRDLLEMGATGKRKQH